MDDLLFLAHRIPYPPNKGDKIRSYHLLRELAGSHRVHLGAFIDDPYDQRYRDKLQEVCESVFLPDLNPSLARLRSFSGLLKNEALSIPYYYDRRMQSWVDGLLAGGNVRKIFVFSSPMSQYAMNIKEPSTCRVVDFVDVDSDKWRQYATRKSWPASWVYDREGRKLLAYEQLVADRFDTSLFVSADEAALFRSQTTGVTGQVDYLDNGVDHDYFSPARAYDNPYTANEAPLVFTGAMDYWANIDAVTWFADEVFPRVRESVADARFYIVGARPPGKVRQLADRPGVVVTGAVEDVRPYLAHTRLAVAPLRIARGIQNKVLEAMSMAVPVVATPAAVAGIEYNDPDGLQVSDDAQDFAGKVVRLLQQQNMEASQASRQWVCQRYDWNLNLRKLHEIFEPFPH